MKTSELTKEQEAILADWPLALQVVLKAWDVVEAMEEGSVPPIADLKKT